MTPTHFDIYIRQGGRWRRHEQLPGADKDAAILRAADIDENGGYDGVRAMAVVEYGSGRAPLETLAWISPHLNKTAAVKRQMADSAAQAEKAVAAKADKAVAAKAEMAGEDRTPIRPSEPLTPVDAVQSFVEPQKKPSASAQARGKAPPDGNQQVRAVAKIVGAGFLALGITAVLFVPISGAVRSLGADAGLSSAAIQNTIFAASLFVFVITAAFLMVRVYREYLTLMDQIAEYEPPPDPVPVARPRPRTQARGHVPSAPVPSAQDEPATDGDAAKDENRDDDGHEDKAPGAEGGPDQAAGGLNENMRRNVLEFLAQALSAIKDEVPRMNQHVTFGLNLFGAGAAERYGEHAGLKKVQSFVLVREVVGALGNSEERVDAFCRNFEEYRAEERFRMMINAGRNTMARRIEGDTQPFEDFADTVNMWTSDSAARAQAQGIVCIMFTDLVGSTQMTHERGDYGAQEIVRIHNAIVRTALAAHHGREVKHTGDGIMASFSTAANAVRAGMEIRESLREHNAREDAFPVRVRLGLNAGEAVQEEDDFFGTTVQLAARVCDKAGEGEIFVTDNVRELSKGQGLGFEESGKFEMKGVPEPMTLYRVGETES